MKFFDSLHWKTRANKPRKIFEVAQKLLKKGALSYFDHTLYNIFIVSYGFKDIYYESNIIDLFCLCFPPEFTRGVICFMLILVYLCFIENK